MKETQASNIKSYLLAGNTLTSVEAYEKFGCTRLASRICDLRKQGIKVVTEMIDGRTRYGSHCQYARYYIKK